jgi:hypothetical protein
MAAILRCRTAELGGHAYRCDHCGHLEIFYNSCRNRHCPKCQALAQARWLEAREAELLPVGYFHVVFTIPRELHAFFRADAKRTYALLFAATAETLQEVALNPRHLGARIGFMAVLHTWTQKLLFHPHIHCIVPAGGLDPDEERWIDTKSRFFLPVSILSEVFRGKLLSKIEAALADGSLESPKAEPKQLLREASCKRWSVYCKPPFASPEKVLAYLGRYTHRIAISNQRLVSLSNGQVAFRYRDRADGNRVKILQLSAVSFLRRFLLHVLPDGFVRIRHYGFLANGVKRRQLATCRKLLVPAEPEPPATEPSSEPWEQLLGRLTGRDVLACPACDEGHLECIAFSRARTSSLREWIPGRGSSP